MPTVRQTAIIRITHKPGPLFTRTRATRKKESILIMKPHPAVWAKALQLAHGDTRRLVVFIDGSVLVVNRPGKGKK